MNGALQWLRGLDTWGKTPTQMGVYVFRRLILYSSQQPYL